MMDLKDLLKEMFDNYPECAKDYEIDIMDRYEIEVENKKLTPEEIENLTNLYFDKPKNNYIGNEDNEKII
ncbi:hypothetical protein [Spiroplasma endosymbiont of Phyllotreta cruciferae]|uniref:hypothetical protein n=1 Tax=Spiroplasma endosymbiont of Phyllotreta cruciferae TaxID=2886375 RepID=UPI00209D8374|nr:hypothetical protein [Spiroplasma endosymbiont of Phyllotreta cruciferae]